MKIKFGSHYGDWFVGTGKPITGSKEVAPKMALNEKSVGGLFNDGQTSEEFRMPT